MAKKKRKDRRRKRGGIGSFISPVPGSVRQEIEELIEAENAEGALVVIEEWLEKRPDHPLLSFYAGSAYAMLEVYTQALVHFRTAARRDRRNEAIFYNLVVVYMHLEYTSHALRMLNRYLKTEMVYEEGHVASMRELRGMLMEELRAGATFFGVDVDVFEEVLYWNEESQIELMDHNWQAAIAAADKALVILPDHAPALNNRALALQYAGQLDEAIADEQRVATLHPNNVHALANLVRFYYLKQDEPNARLYLAQLQGLCDADWEGQTSPIDKILEAHAFAGTNAEIYAFVKKYATEISARGRYMLGAAAANLGKKREARKMWQQVIEDGLGWREMAEQALAALAEGKPGLGRASQFPYVTVQELLSETQLTDLVSVLQAYDDDDPARDQALANVVAQHSGFLAAARWFLWYGEEVEMGGRLLAMIGTDAAWDALRDFAFGRDGADEERMNAAHLLVQHGKLDADQPVRLWIDGEPRELLLKQFEISDEPEDLSEYSEEVIDLITQVGEAHEAEDNETVEKIYHHILELEPGCTMAYNNLARIAQMREDWDTARGYLEKSLEIDPHYVFGRCNLANIYLQDDEVDRAKETIAPLVERTHFTPPELKIYQLVQAQIMIQDGDWEPVGQALEVLTELYPDDPEVNAFREYVDKLRPLGKLLSRVRKREKERRERKDSRPLDDGASLETCLDRHTKEELQYMAQQVNMPGISSMKKAEQVAAVAGHLRDEQTFRTLAPDFSDAIREALGYVSDSGGAVMRVDFVERFGSDEKDGYWHPQAELKSTLGQLCARGLLFVGTRRGEKYVQIPDELRDCVRKLLADT